MPKVTFIADAITVDVPVGVSLLEAARACHAQVGSACGGNLACSTCHVYVKRGGDALSEMEDGENDILDKAFDVRSSSRLGCQAKIEEADAVIEVDISRESRQAFLDEHPDERRAEEAAAP